MNYSKPQQPRALKTERKFLVATEIAFAKNGFMASTIDDIADIAGLHRGAFLKRFGSKKNALQLLLRKMHAEGYAAINTISQRPHEQSQTSFLEVLQEITLSLLQVAASNAGALRGGLEMGQTDPDIRRELWKMFLRAAKILKNLLKRFQPEKSPSTASISAATLIWMSIITPMTYHAGQAYSVNHKARPRREAAVQFLLLNGA